MTHKYRTTKALDKITMDGWDTRNTGSQKYAEMVNELTANEHK